MRNI
jgi:hypothetical protein